MTEKQHQQANPDLHTAHFLNRVRQLPDEHLQHEHSPDETFLTPTIAHTESNNMEELTSEETSSMPHEARRVLVYVMRQGAILASENAKSFDILCRFEQAIRQHLSEVYLSLVIDRKFGVAYIQNSEAEQHATEFSLEDVPSLIRKRTLTLFDTLVLLVLRKYYQEREKLGEQKIMIDLERIQLAMIPFLPISNHESKDKKKLGASLEKFSEKKILKQLRGEEGRYEVSPLIRYVVHADFLATLLEEYQTLAKQALEKEPA